MAQLAGKFAGISKVSIDTSHLDGLKHSLESLSQSGIHTIDLVDDNTTTPAITVGKTLAFELMGADRQGIVSEISAFLSTINIDELETIAQVLVRAVLATGLPSPQETDTNQLLQQLDSIEDKLGVDITFPNAIDRTFVNSLHGVIS